MGALVADLCAVVPPFTQVQGRVTRSRGGRLFGGRGQMRIAFDSLEVRRGTWVSMTAALDTLEYEPSRDGGPSGTVYGRRVSIGKRLVPAGIVGAADVDVIPAALLGGFLIGLCTIPCSGAIYLAIVALLAAQHNPLTAYGYLLLYNVLFIAPLLAILVLASSRPLLTRLARWQREHRERVRLVIGAGVTALGLLLLGAI